MLWLILALLTALTVSSHDAWVKKFFSDLSPYEMAAYPMLYSLPLFIPALFFVPTPPLDTTFWWCFLASLPLNGVSFILYMKAIKVSPLSLTIPYLAFTPVFMIATGYLLLGERPNLWGLAGIVTTCLGSYILNFEPAKESILSPLKSVIKETGSWLMLIVAFLFSFAAVVGKNGILHSSVLFFSVSFFTVFNLVLLLLMTVQGKISLGNFIKRPIQGLVAGCLYFLHVLFHGFAIYLAKAAYMISIKRFSILISVIYGGVFFKESHIKIRFIGAGLMVSGAVIIIIKGS
jgi:drug/metabolite transporter (DMT)-like permease